MKPSAMPRAVGDILPDAVPQLVDRLAEVRVYQAWGAIVGAEIAPRTRPAHLVEGCLTVVVDNSPWLHELSLRQAEVLSMIQRHCPSVRALRLTVGQLLLPSPDHAAAAARPAAPLSEQDRHEIEEATAIIADAALATAARRLLTRARRATGASKLAP